jgi:hypothetical protein
MRERDPNRVKAEGGGTIDRDAVSNARKLAAEQGVDLDRDRPGWNSSPERLAHTVADLMARTSDHKGVPVEPRPERLEEAHDLAERHGVPLPDDWAVNRETTETVIETAKRAAETQGSESASRTAQGERPGGPRPEGRTPGR